MSDLKLGRLFLNALVLALLGACAGGGGGGGPGVVVSPPPPPSPPVFPSLAPPHADGDFPSTAGSEFTANWGVGGINAQVAWQNGATGAGVLVGVIDTGIHPEHPELAGRISPNSIDIRAGRNALVTNETHGSELSSLIAGNYNGAQTVGVAFDATILAIRADNGAGSFENTDLANAINYARQQGVDVINLSLGSSSPSPANVEQAIRTATAAGIIIVVSAGNDGDTGATRPNYPGFLAIDPLVSNGLIMIAGGLNPNGTVNPASNPPGIADDWYITAPGWQIIVPDYGAPGPVPGFQSCGAAAGIAANLCRIQGTSYASPHVAGAVALVMDAFPGLTPQQVVDLLLTTADDTGPAGIDAVNGRGRLNVGRAFQPVGPLAVPLMSSAMELTPDTLLGGVGAAFGDGMTINTAAWTVAGFDHYDRTFPVNFADNWLAAASPSALAQAPLLWRTSSTDGRARMQIAFADETLPESYRGLVDRADFEQTPVRIDADLAPGLTASIAAHGARTMYDRTSDAVGHLAFVDAELSLQLTRQIGDGVSVSLLSESGVTPESIFQGPTDRSASAARASFNGGAFGFDLTVGRVEEESGLLGLTWSRDFGATPAGETRFTGVGAQVNLAPGVDVAANAEFGVAALSGSGWLNVTSPLRTSAFSLETTFALTPSWLADGDGAVSVSISQPLRIEGGTLSFTAPVATKYGRQSLSYEERAFSPTPSGRELRFGLGYRYFAGETLSAFGEALYVLDPAHIAAAEPDTVLRFGLRASR